MRTCWRLFAFGGADRQAAQVWLNAQTAAGWRLKGVYGGLLARFEQDTINTGRTTAGSGPPEAGGWRFSPPSRAAFPSGRRETGMRTRPVCSGRLGGAAWGRRWRRC